MDTVLQDPRSACFSAGKMSMLACSVNDFADFKVDVYTMESGYPQVVVKCQVAPGFKPFTVKKTFRSEKSFNDELDGYGDFMYQFVSRLWKSMYTPLIAYYKQALNSLSFEAAQPDDVNCKVSPMGPSYTDGWGLYITVNSVLSQIVYVSQEYTFNPSTFSIDECYDAIDDIMSKAEAEIPAMIDKYAK
jgi:hypothetical protein